jgi:hypothetical protein
MTSNVKRDNVGSNQIAPKRRPNPERPSPERPSPERLKFEELLDEAIEETFPASDPVSLNQPVKTRRKEGGTSRPTRR